MENPNMLRGPVLCSPGCQDRGSLSWQGCPALPASSWPLEETGHVSSLSGINLQIMVNTDYNKVRKLLFRIRHPIN